MFGFFGKRKPKTALDALIIQIYGSLEHKKTANLDTATNLAFEALLCTAIDYQTVRKKAEELFSGKIPYSTNDLAISVALAFFQDQHNRELLSEAQLVARMQLIEWLNEGTVAGPIAVAFENALYKQFMPR